MNTIEPQTLQPLDPSIIQQLIDLHNKSKQLKIPGRVFSHDIDAAIQLVMPIIESILGNNTWILSGGNFFETRVGYRVHADTGFEGPSKVWQTIVFPLEMDINEFADLEKNRLIIFNQSWKKRSSFFLRGGDPYPEVSENSPYDLVFNYTDVINTNSNIISEEAATLCPHLDRRDLEGLTIDRSLLWTPGIPMTFPRDRLHASTAFPRVGVPRKLGLSLFFSSK